MNACTVARGQRPVGCKAREGSEQPRGAPADSRSPATRGECGKGGRAYARMQHGTWSKAGWVQGARRQRAAARRTGRQSQTGHARRMRQRWARIRTHEAWNVVKGRLGARRAKTASSRAAHRQTVTDRPHAENAAKVREVIEAHCRSLRCRALKPGEEHRPHGLMAIYVVSVRHSIGTPSVLARAYQ